ncbi:MAG TPA: flagellar hook-basal body protein [Chthonomonadales bacterium]|nr:flagellar hook-basal body protein [Chthonomonadales bacterium]
MVQIVRGIYSAATGMLAQQFVLDGLAGNLSNLSTTGFKQGVPTFQALRELAILRMGGPMDEAATPIGSLGMGAAFSHTELDLTDGPLQRTDDPLDAALIGGGFFTVLTPFGERHTRAGHFELQPAGRAPDGRQTAWLVDGAGNRVVGMRGPIRIADPRDVGIQPSGVVTSAGVEVDRLKVVDADAASITKLGGNLLLIDAPRPLANVVVRSGFLEQSNVNPVASMVKMISVQRAYELAQRAVKSQDEALERVVNEVPRR